MQVQLKGQADGAIIAAAQSISVAGDIAANVQRHLQLMRAAAGEGVSFLLFPELSLTGYEPSLAAELAISKEDQRLQPIAELAHALGMMTVVGAPLRLPEQSGIYIAALTFGVADAPLVYTKQHLHAGEASVFRAGCGGSALPLATEQVSLAVCADFSEAFHARAAAASGTSVYAASVLISEAGYANDAALLAQYAAEHRMAVLMANHGGPTGGWTAAGRSALWSETGALVCQAPGQGDHLLIGQRKNGEWTAACLPVRFEKCHGS